MRAIAFLALSTLGFVAACKRTDDGKLVIERPGEVDVKVKSDTVHLPSIGTQKETVTTPSVEMKEETLIVKKPVIGSKKTEISKPVIKP
ncbi:MAG TPA: hypothetical protein VJN70_12255 [Gemmatimonadaceae bacterium]|nr:hypothetical protein [Gemmatimonadaceae bacterium]